MEKGFEDRKCVTYPTLKRYLSWGGKWWEMVGGNWER